MTTPIRNTLKAQSLLARHVGDGLGAVRQAHKQLIDKQVRSHFADSLDIDDRLRDSHEQENRWDYLLGHEASSLVVGFEPHSAYTGEVSTVIAKKNAAREQLRVHLRSGASIAACEGSEQAAATEEVPVTMRCDRSDEQKRLHRR